MDPLRRLLRSPTGWFLLNLAEYLVAIALFRWLVPEGVPFWAGLLIFVGTIAALVWVNVRIARRLRRDG